MTATIFEQVAWLIPGGTAGAGTVQAQVEHWSRRVIAEQFACRAVQAGDHWHEHGASTGKARKLTNAERNNDMDWEPLRSTCWSICILPGACRWPLERAQCKHKWSTGGASMTKLLKYLHAATTPKTIQNLCQNQAFATKSYTDKALILHRQSSNLTLAKSVKTIRNIKTMDSQPNPTLTKL